MKTAFKQVKEAMGRLDELQALHIDAFETQLIPDLEKQIDQRKELFSDLKKRLTAFFMETETMDPADTKPMIKDVNASLLSLMHQNMTLKTKVQTHKTQLENSMKNISKGRQAIHAYGFPASQRNQPKVISTRNN